MDAKRRKRQIARKFHEQGGLCYWCKQPMILLSINERHQTDPLNRATIDHLDDRYSPDRGKFPGEIRRVVACWKCNNGRNKKRQAQMTGEKLTEWRDRFKSKSEGRSIIRVVAEDE